MSKIQSVVNYSTIQYSTLNVRNDCDNNLNVLTFFPRLKDASSILKNIGLYKSRDPPAFKKKYSTGLFGTSMSTHHILELEKVPRVRLFAD